MNEQSAPEAESETQGGGFKLAFELKSWFRDILLAFAIAIFIVIFVIQPVKVEGTSMQPRLVDQERIFVNRFIYRFQDIHRGDVVVFWYPQRPQQVIYKEGPGDPGGQGGDPVRHFVCEWAKGE